MRLFKRKEKKLNKKKSKKGCLTKLAVVVLFLAVFFIGLANGVTAVQTLYGEELDVVGAYIEIINKPVTEEELILNPVATIEEFGAVADASGFVGYTNLNGLLELRETIKVEDRVFGAMINNHLKRENPLIYLGEFSITSENTIRMVYIYDLKDIKLLLDEAGDIIPNKMYITVDYEYTVVESAGERRAQYTVVNKSLNQLDKETSDKILSYLDKVEQNNIENPLKTYDKHIFDTINNIGIKTSSMLYITVESNTGYVTYLK